VKISLVGLGLIGSSIARALRGKHEIVAYNRSEKTRRRALELGIVSACFDSIKNAVEDADIIIICTPLSTYEPILKEVAEHIKPDALVTDVGSVKTIAVELGNKYIGKENFIAGHPIAGTENSGVDAGFAELFQGKKVILTPEIMNENVEKLQVLWKETGADVHYLDCKKHDEIYAFVSHLAQFLCWISLENEPSFDTEDKYLHQFYRIVASDEKMWKDIFLYNKQPLIETLNEFLSVLEDIKNADKNELVDIFTKANLLRKESFTDDVFDMKDVVLKEDYLLPVIVSFAYAKAVYDLDKKYDIPIGEHTCTSLADMTLFALCDVEKSVELVLNSDTSEIIESLKTRSLNSKFIQQH